MFNFGQYSYKILQSLRDRTLAFLLNVKQILLVIKVILTLRQMIAIIILFYYNDVSMLLASFSS